MKAGLRGASEAKEACTLQQFNAPGNRNWTGAAVDLEGEVRCFLYFLWLKDAKVENGSLPKSDFPRVAERLRWRCYYFCHSYLGQRLLRESN